MSETALDLVERMKSQGKSTEDIRAALNSKKSADASGSARKLTIAGKLAGSLAPLAPLAPWLAWGLIVYLCLVPAVGVIHAQVAGEGFPAVANLLLTLGGVTATVGLVLYALALVLSTRAVWLEDLFGGASSVLRAHQLLGELSLFPIFLHPLLAAGSFYPSGSQAVLRLFVPRSAEVGLALGVLALVLLLALAALAFYKRLTYKLWLNTHRYLGLVYLLIALHVLLTPNHTGIADAPLRGYLYVVMLIGAAAYVYRSLLPNVFVRRYVYTIVSAEKKGIGVVEVKLAPVSRKIPFRAGQFVFLSFDNDGLSPEWHPFSITSSETAADLMIDIKSLGAYTETLTRLLPYMVGMTVRVEGAYGRFSYRNFANKNQVWVAGGIGIAPFLSMAQTLGEGQYNIDLYYSVQAESELVNLNILSAKQSSKPGQYFRVFPFIAAKYNTFLSADIIAKNSGGLDGREFLLCGQHQMMKAAKKQLMEKGVPASHIHVEDFSPE
jgi:predicted ferric reductase